MIAAYFNLCKVFTIEAERGLMIVIVTGFIPVYCFDDDFVGKEPVTWKE